MSVIVHVVDREGGGHRVFVAMSPLDQRAIVAFHAQLVRYVRPEELADMEYFDPASPPRIVGRRGRAVGLRERDRIAGRAVLELRAKERAEAIAREPPPPPLPPPAPARPIDRGPPPSTAKPAARGAAIVLSKGERARIVDEVIAWYRHRRGTLSASWELAGSRSSSPDVLDLVDRRAALLRDAGAYPHDPPERSGRLLEITIAPADPVVLPHDVLFGGSGLPPCDFWCWRLDDSLVVWVPAAHLALAEARIARAPDTYRWRAWPDGDSARRKSVGLMPEEIALVAEAFPSFAGVWVLDLEETTSDNTPRKSVFVALDTLSQRHVVALHTNLLTYVTEDALEGITFCVADRLPPVVRKRGRRIELTASDRATAQMMLEQRARIRGVERPPAPSKAVASMLEALEALESTPLLVMLMGRPMTVVPGTSLAVDVRHATIAETMAWDDAQAEPILRSADLAHFAPEMAGVLQLAVRRAALLREMREYPSRPPGLEGRLLSCELGLPAPLRVVPEVFEPNGMPAWDLWCWATQHRLVAWIPERLEHHVATQMDLAPGRYRWLPW